MMHPIVAQVINCADLWWAWPCWWSSYGKVLLEWGGVALALTVVLSRTLARAK